jgi:hypothetical protein
MDHFSADELLSRAGIRVVLSAQEDSVLELARELGLCPALDLWLLVFPHPTPLDNPELAINVALSEAVDQGSHSLNQIFVTRSARQAHNRDSGII